MLAAMPSFAQDVWITEDIPYVELEINQEFILIERVQDTDAVISSAFAKTSRPCPPSCIQPVIVADGVEMLGELELIAFMEESVQSGEGFLVDSRAPRFFVAGTIPGSINLPFNLLVPNDTNPFADSILLLLGGAKQSDGSWSFANPRILALYCDGPWCDQAPRAINNLLTYGYPADSILYYRGGIQSWLMFGLPIVEPPS